MEESQARIKLDRFIRVRTGKASIQLSQFLSKIGKDESWLAGIKKGTTCVEPDTFKPALKYLKIKHGSQEYYEFGCYVYTILDDTEKEEFSTLYSKKDVNDMLEKYSKIRKPAEKTELKIDEPKEHTQKVQTSSLYGSFHNELYMVINDRIKSLNMSWTDLETLIGTRTDRIKTIGQFSVKYLKDLLDALNIKHDSDEARNIVELAKANFKFKAKQDEFDAEYRRILDNDANPVAKEVSIKKEEIKVEEKTDPKIKESEEPKEPTQKVQASSLYGSFNKEPSHNKSYAKKEFSGYLSYLIVVKGLSLYSFSQMIGSSEDDVKDIIEGRKTFGIFQAMRIPDLLELDAASTREFNHKYLATQDNTTDIDFPEYVTKYLHTHPSAILAIAKAADANADNSVWKNLYTEIVSF